MVNSQCAPLSTSPKLQSQRGIPEKRVVGEELFENFVDLLRVFFLQLLPSCLFGILSLILQETAGLLNKVAASFRKEDHIPSESSQRKLQTQFPAQTTPRDETMRKQVNEVKPRVSSLHTVPITQARGNEPVSVVDPISQSMSSSDRTDSVQNASQVSGFLAQETSRPLESIPPYLMNESNNSTAKQRVFQLPAEVTSQPETVLDGTTAKADIESETRFPDLVPGKRTTKLDSAPMDETFEELGADLGDEYLEDAAAESECGPTDATELGDGLPPYIKNRPFPGKPNSCAVEPPTLRGSVLSAINPVQRLTHSSKVPPPPPYHIAVAKHARQEVFKLPPSTNPSSHSHHPVVCALPSPHTMVSEEQQRSQFSHHCSIEGETKEVVQAPGERGPERSEPNLKDDDQKPSDMSNLLAKQDACTHRDSSVELTESGSRGKAHMHSFVAARVDAYENFLVATEAESESPLKIPMPDPSVLPSVCVTGAASADPMETSNDCLISKLCSLSDVQTTDPSPHVKEPREAETVEITGEDEDERRFEDQEESDALARCSSKAVDVLVGSVRDLDYGYTSASSKDESTQRSLRINSEAPTGADCLQEMIPEIMPEVSPRVTSQTSPVVFAEADPSNFPAMDEFSLMDDTTPDLFLDEAAIISVASMERIDNLPSFPLPPRNGSDLSLRTESYSSPDSPIQGSSTDSMLQARHRDSWRASDHDLFSEDPMMDMEGSGIKTNKRYSRQIKGSRFDGSMLEEYDSTRLAGMAAVKSKRKESADSLENEISASTPVTSQTDRNSTQSRLDDLDSMQSWRYSGRSPKRRPGIAENNLFRQASIDVTILGSPVTASRTRQGAKDRVRSARPRFTPSQLSSRVSVSSMVGRPPPSIRMGRSISSSETRFEDWPEYRPSQDDPTSMGRRHQSDMSFGSRARKIDLLPADFVSNNGPTLVGYQHGGDDMPHRFGGPRKGWKMGFGRAPIYKDSGDVKGVMKNILRRRRKGSNLEEVSFTPTGVPSMTNSYHRGSGDKSRRSGGTETEFTFDIELPQDTVFPLLSRICPECGYRVVVRRAHHKIKIEIPLNGGSAWLLLSISLTRLSSSRGTHVSLSRSKDDLSGGPDRHIEAAGILLRTRLGSHVEFLEDSFASLQVGNAAMEVRRT